MLCFTGVEVFRVRSAGGIGAWIYHAGGFSAYDGLHVRHGHYVGGAR